MKKHCHPGHSISTLPAKAILIQETYIIADLNDMLIVIAPKLRTEHSENAAIVVSNALKSK